MDEQTLRRYSLQEYISKGGNPPEHFSLSTIYYLLEENEKILGKIAFVESFFMGWPPHYFILQVKSHCPERQGVGSCLVRAVESEAVKNKVDLIALKFKRPNLWKKIGYEIDKEENLAWKKLSP